MNTSIVIILIIIPTDINPLIRGEYLSPDIIFAFLKPQLRQQFRSYWYRLNLVRVRRTSAIPPFSVNKSLEPKKGARRHLMLVFRFVYQYHSRPHSVNHNV